VTVRPARLSRALAASALVLLLPLAACAGTDASGDAAGATASGSSAPAGVSASATEETPKDAAPRAEAGQRIAVEIAGGQVSGDTGRVPVAVGTQVTLVITSDVADEVHVHGYDLSADLAPGTPAEITFTATIPGVFEVELHEAGTALLALQVS
jgi:plastocyanin